MPTRHIEYAFFETPPFIAGISEPDRLTDECAGLPEPFRDELIDLLANPDSTRCARCDDPAGFVLVEKPSGHEELEWFCAGLAREGDGPVVVFCDQCTPYLPEPAPIPV